jgi:3-methyladenine DNA glycosylase/8-oxoguanine DNA glycosylase
MQLTLPARQPFRFHATIHSHGWYQLAPLQWDEAAGLLHRPERLVSGRIVLLTIGEHPQGIAVQTAIQLTPAEVEEVTAKASWMFNLAADFEEFYILADQEPRLAHCRPQAHGRLLRSPTLFEDIVKTMATTNIQWSGTKRLVRRLVDALGEPLSADETIRTFPTPAAIAATDEAALRALGWGYRSPYLLKLAQGLVAGTHELDPLRVSDLATPELRKALLKLPGIGPYAAATLLGLLGRHDYIGVDTEAVSQVSKAFYGGQPVGEKEINAVFDHWGKYKSLAYWFWDYAGTQQAPMVAWVEQRSTEEQEREQP